MSVSMNKVDEEITVVEDLFHQSLLNRKGASFA